MISLAEQIDIFFAKDPDMESVIRSFLFWTEMSGVEQMELRLRDKVVWQNGNENQLDQMMKFKQGNWEVRIFLSELSWKNDSDVKCELLGRVSLAFMSRLEQIEMPSVIHIKRSN